MTVSHRFVILSGIPGCGKTTVGRALATHLEIPYVSKDDILESFLEDLESCNEKTRHRLSRSADQAFQARALNCEVAVLDSFWRHPLAETQSGTPSGWLISSEVHAVEVLCVCHPELAAMRFLERKRHIGHLDSAWNKASLVAQSQELMKSLPLGVGVLIKIDTTDALELGQLTAKVKNALDVDLSKN